MLLDRNVTVYSVTSSTLRGILPVYRNTEKAGLNCYQELFSI